MPVVIKKKTTPNEAVVVAQTKMGITKVRVSSSGPIDTKVAEKVVVRVERAEELSPTGRVMSQPPLQNIPLIPPNEQEQAVVITHDFPKDYKVCKKGDTGVVIKENGDLIKVRLNDPKTEVKETWVYRNQVASR